jgi:dihydrofolate reductase
MRRLVVFNHVSVDGYFVDSRGDMSWAHASDPEFNAFVEENASGEAELLFGRVTYDLMASYWPTPLARENDPHVATMNNLPKVVFSRTMGAAVAEHQAREGRHRRPEVRRMKDAPGPDNDLRQRRVVSPAAQAG